MARINIYLPDELHAAVKVSGLNISRVCQEALEKALPLPDESAETEVKYTIDVPPSEFVALIRDLQSAIASMARYKLALKRTLGAAHPSVLEINSQIARAERNVTALKLAQHNAINPPAVTPRRETPARNVGDELPVVYGRPRNDPRTPKKIIK